MNSNCNILVLATFILSSAFSSVLYSAERFPSNQQPSGYLPNLVLSSTNIANGANAYRTWYENGSWQGDIVQYDVSSLGGLSSSVNLSTITPTNSGSNWSARLQFLNAENNANYWSATRKIITISNGIQVPFRWDRLTDSEKEALDPVSFAASSTSSNILDYIRGDRSSEEPTGSMRKRYSLLGDIVHSTPVYVAQPNSDIYESSYITFKNDRVNRAARLYAGANDGMLHVFNAVTGDEVYAFVPPSAFSNLAKLTKVPYSH